MEPLAQDQAQDQAQDLERPDSAVTQAAYRNPTPPFTVMTYETAVTAPDLCSPPSEFINENENSLFESR